MFYIFSFRARVEAMRYYDNLRREGVDCAIVNTPRAANLGCGLSVRVDVSQLSKARNVLAGTTRSTFLGLFEQDYTGNIVRRM